jgi:translation initiation factor 1 (eIF-1/SUI1)
MYDVSTCGCAGAVDDKILRTQGQVHKDVTIDGNHFKQTQGLPAVSGA